MRISNFDEIPHTLQQSIYYIFDTMNIRDKVIFLSRLEYSEDMTYKDISEMTGITFQRTQQLFNDYMDKIKNITLSKESNIILSGVII